MNRVDPQPLPGPKPQSTHASLGHQRISPAEGVEPASFDSRTGETGLLPPRLKSQVKVMPPTRQEEQGMPSTQSEGHSRPPSQSGATANPPTTVVELGDAGPSQGNVRSSHISSDHPAVHNPPPCEIIIDGPISEELKSNGSVIFC